MEKLKVTELFFSHWWWRRVSMSGPLVDGYSDTLRAVRDLRIIAQTEVL